MANIFEKLSRATQLSIKFLVNEEGSLRSKVASFGLFIILILVLVILFILTPDTVKWVWRKLVMKLISTLGL